MINSAPHLHALSQPLAKTLVTEKWQLIITPDEQSALLLSQLLRFWREDLAILVFPAWDTLTYESLPVHEGVVSERLRTLYQLQTTPGGVVIASPRSLLYRLLPKELLLRHTLILKKGEECDPESLRKNFVAAGYHMVSEVYARGEMAIRGHIIDIFAMGQTAPIRIDLFDTIIDRLSFFNPDTQRTTEDIEAFECLPARECLHESEQLHCFRTHFRELFPKALEAPIYRQISNGELPPGVEYYLPLFYEYTASVIDYFPSTPLIYHIGEVFEAASTLFKEIQSRYQQHPFQDRLLEPVSLASPPQAFQKTFKPTKHFTFEDTNTQRALPDVSRSEKNTSPLSRLQTLLEAHVADTIIFSTPTPGRMAILDHLLLEQGIAFSHVEDIRQVRTTGCFLGCAPLQKGWEDLEHHTLYITEMDILGHSHITQKTHTSSINQHPQQLLRSLQSVSIGDYLVHAQHGIGCYAGLVLLTIQDFEEEFLQLNYAHGDKLFVPITQLHLISRYIGHEGVSCHALGSRKWQKEREKAEKKITDVASQLLLQHAKKALAHAPAFSIENDYHSFCSNFPYSLTPDQATTMNQIETDLSHQKPMDRLICGDVGFGKTELAMRAAFLSIDQGYCVMFFAPTTILAQQHYHTATNRFHNTGARIALLSRLSPPKEQEKILADLQAGKIDLMIGTHILLRKTIKPPKLGLLIIDEEQRFGTQHKAQLRARFINTHVLTLSATPIPRTLSLSLSGLRDLSIIATPPPRRLPVKTTVGFIEPAVIHDAISREMHRGGQIYYLHNDIKSMEARQFKLQETFPTLRIGVAHGQLPPRALDRIMLDFYEQRYQLLLCTTIIESGLDVQNANTLIVEQAHRFGLAQLHQLRGRIGRSHQQAYAYFLTPPTQEQGSNAQARLKAIAQIQYLGAGFQLASVDLDIRGAGEILGEAQSGHIDHLGFSLYMELLQKAIDDLKHDRLVDLTMPKTQEILLHIPTLIPATYIADVHLRLQYYQRINQSDSSEDRELIMSECIDRFGPPPKPLKDLFELTDCLQQIKTLGIDKVECFPTQSRITFSDKPQIVHAQLIEWIQKESKIYQLDKQQRLIIKKDFSEPQTRLPWLKACLKALTPPSGAQTDHNAENGTR